MQTSSTDYTTGTVFNEIIYPIQSNLMFSLLPFSMNVKLVHFTSKETYVQEMEKINLIHYLNIS